MKKLLILLLLSIPTLLFAEYEITLITPYEEEITIEIPDSDLDRVELIVAVSELYWGERYDLEQKLEDEQELIAEIITLIAELENTNKLLDKAKKDLKATEVLLDEALKAKTTFFKWGLQPSIGAIFTDNELSYQFQLGAEVMFWEWLTAGVEIGYPFQASVKVGVYF